MMNFRTIMFTIGFASIASLYSADANAQSTSTHSGVNMWGTVPGGVSVTGSVDSAIAHAQNGAAAGQVAAAKNGLLMGNGITVQSIGSQSIVQTTINGNNNNASTTATQTTTNSGPVTNTGTVK